MFCRKCGNEMMDEDRYCLRCGHDQTVSGGQNQTGSIFDANNRNFLNDYNRNHSKSNAGKIGFGIFVVYAVISIVSMACLGDFSLSDMSVHNYSMTNSNVEITLEEFYKIQNGMTYDEVKNIIGCNGTLMQETEFMGTKSHMFSWEGKTIGSNAVIMFDNGRVMSKTQVGLE